MIPLVYIVVGINIAMLLYNGWMLRELRSALEAAHPTDEDGNPIPHFKHPVDIVLKKPFDSGSID